MFKKINILISALIISFFSIQSFADLWVNIRNNGAPVTVRHDYSSQYISEFRTVPHNKNTLDTNEEMKATFKLSSFAAGDSMLRLIFADAKGNKLQCDLYVYCNPGCNKDYFQKRTFSSEDGGPTCKGSEYSGPNTVTLNLNLGSEKSKAENKKK